MIADAGRDPSATVGEPVTVGTETNPPGVAKPRAPGWRIVSAPDGSGASLARPRSLTPELVPDLPGTYVLRLVLARGGGTARDTVAVTARPPDPPIGVSLETLSGAADGAIRIDGAGVKDTTDRNGVFVAVLERTTRAIVESGTVPRQGGGIAQLKSIAAKWGGDAHNDRYLMIVSGPSGWSGGDVSAFNDLVTSLGGEKLGPDERSSLSNGHPFSVVGIPGGAPGAGWTKIPAETGTELNDPQAGNIHGYLQLNQAAENPLAQKHYDLVSPDHLDFDTRSASGQTTSNSIVWQGQTVTDSLPAGATAGFHLALVDSMTGAVLEHTAMPTNGGDYEGAPAPQQEIGAKLLTWAYESLGHPILVVQSIGKPNGNTLGWNDMSDGIARFGGNKFVFNGLDGNYEYAFVGRLGDDAPAVESSTSAGEEGELSGILSRGRDFRYSPLLAADELSPVTTEMFEIAYQDPESFPAIDAKAETYIGNALRFCDAGSASCPVRKRYYENYDGTAWSQKYNDLNAIAWPGEASGIGKPEFDHAKERILDEISALTHIKNYFDALQKPFLRVQGRSLLDLQKLGEQLKQDVAADEGRSSGWGLQLIAAVLAIASEGASEEVAPALSGSAGLFGLVSLFADDDGSPVLADEITGNVNDIAGKLADRYDVAQRGATGVALLMVSDWGKMQAARDRVDNAWKLPPTVDEAIPPLRLASNQWFANALVPATYSHLLRATPPPVGPGTPNGTECWFDIGEGGYYDHPWKDLAPNMQVKVTLLHERTGQATKTSLWATRGFKTFPSGTVGNLLFNQPGQRPAGLGLHPLRFFDPALFDGKVLSANDTATRCDLPF